MGEIWRLSGAEVNPQIPTTEINASTNPELVSNTLTTTINDVWLHILNQMSIRKFSMERSWWLYLRPMHRILCYFEEHKEFYRNNHIRGCKLCLFTLLPVREFVPKCTHIDTTILKDIINRWFGIRNAEDPWQLFNLNQVVRNGVNNEHGFPRFQGSITTDGVRCSVRVQKQAPVPAIVDDFGHLLCNNEYQPIQENGDYNNVIGIDTGHGVWFAGYRGKDARCDDMEDVDRNEEKQKKVVYKVERWKEKSGT